MERGRMQLWEIGMDMKVTRERDIDLEIEMAGERHTYIATYSLFMQLLKSFVAVKKAYGELTLSNGLTYRGSWRDNTDDSYGEIILPDGHIYKGGWRDDKHDGYGGQDNLLIIIQNNIILPLLLHSFC